MRRIFIGTPVARDPTWQYTESIVETALALERAGIDHERRFVVGTSNVAKARNQLVAFFMASACTDLVFIDDDMGWSADDFLRLIDVDKDVIAAVGRKRCEPPAWCYRPLKEGMRDGDLIEVGAVGTAFMRIRRSVFERMIAKDPACKRIGVRRDLATPKPIKFYHIFRFGDDIGEDYAFCDRWRELGGRVWIDPRIALTHVGNHAFAGRLADTLEEA